MKKKIILLAAIVVFLASWASIAYSDYADVAISYDQPKFCISTMTADDGGSGKYIGFGYSFDIDGFGYRQCIFCLSRYRLSYWFKLQVGI